MTKTKVLPVLLGLVTLNLLNLFDAYFTYIGVAQGYLEELNPIMDYLLDTGPFFFFACKIILVLLASIFLYLRQAHTLARRVVWCGCVLYLGIAGLHIFHLINLSNLG